MKHRADVDLFKTGEGKHHVFVFQPKTFKGRKSLKAIILNNRLKERKGYAIVKDVLFTNGRRVATGIGEPCAQR